METILLIVLIIIAVVALIAIVTFGALNYKAKGQKVEMPQIDLKEIGILSNKIDSLEKNNEKAINLAISKASNESNEIQDGKLQRFEANITKSLNDRFDSMNKQMESKLEAMNKKVDDKIQEGFKGTSETMSQVRERLQAIDAAQKNIQDLSKDVVSLKTVLQGNQTRGQYGEYQLSMVLHNVFGDVIGAYEEQYTLNKIVDGQKVRADAVVFMPEPNKLICIDSKFPYSQYQKTFEAENQAEKEALIKGFQNDVRKHITDIKNKYIIEGKTAPQALMFIPNDGIFAFIHHNCPETVSYARESSVIIVSPSTLPAILVTINMLRIEVERSKNVKEISKQIGALGTQFDLFAKDWQAFSKQLNTISNTRERLDNRVNKINVKFETIKTNDSGNLLEDNNQVLEQLEEE